MTGTKNNIPLIPTRENVELTKDMGFILTYEKKGFGTYAEVPRFNYEGELGKYVIWHDPYRSLWWWKDDTDDAFTNPKLAKPTCGNLSEAVQVMRSIMKHREVVNAELSTLPPSIQSILLEQVRITSRLRSKVEVLEGKLRDLETWIENAPVKGNEP